MELDIRSAGAMGAIAPGIAAGVRHFHFVMPWQDERDGSTEVWNLQLLEALGALRRRGLLRGLFFSMRVPAHCAAVLGGVARNLGAFGARLDLGVLDFRRAVGSPRAAWAELA